MDNDEINLTTLERTSSADSLEQTDLMSVTSESLRSINGYHKWSTTNKKIRVDKVDLIFYDDDDDDDESIEQKSFSKSFNKNVFQINLENEKEEDNDEHNSHTMDLSLHHNDVQLQVNHDQFEQRIEIFSSGLSDVCYPKRNASFANEQRLQSPEMDMECDNRKTKIVYGYPPNQNNTPTTNNNNYYDANSADKSNKRNNSSNNNDSNGPNPNRNNNNSRRSEDDGSDGGGDDDDDDEDNDDDNGDDDDDDYDDDFIDNDTDENIARRLGFFPLNDEIIHLINRLRNLTRKNSFDRRDFESLQALIDQLIKCQHLEKYSKYKLKQIVRYLRLHRPLQTKSRAFTFIQERIPRRAVKYCVISSNKENTSDVFDIWRRRERRSRLDSKDSLEDDGQNLSGQQLRDVTEINHPTPPILFTNTITTKVKQMAKDIDTRSVSTRSELNIRTNDRLNERIHVPRNRSPSYSGQVTVAVYDVKSVPTTDDGYQTNSFEERFSTAKRSMNAMRSSSPASSEQSHVRKIIDRLESSSNSKGEQRQSFKKSLHDDYSDGSTSLTSSPPVKRIARQDYSDKNLINARIHNQIDTYISHENNSNNDICHQNRTKANVVRFEIGNEEIRNEGRRTASETTTDEYVTNILPGTETSVSMVRDIRACIFDNNTSIARTDVDAVPVKVDVETLYILEQKSDRKSSPSVVNIYIPDYEYNRPPPTETQDFATQTITPTASIRSVHKKPIGTQVDTTIEQHTVAAQTTDSLHRPTRERQRLTTPIHHQENMNCNDNNDVEKVTTTTTTVRKRYEIKRRHSSHHSSEDDDDDDGGGAVIYIDEKSNDNVFEDNFQLKPDNRPSSTENQLPTVPQVRPTFGQITSRIHIDQLCDINRNVVRRHLQDNEYSEDEHRSSEIYEIHTRGACKCLVVSYEEKTQHGSETRFENQLQRIERTYTDNELKSTELHVIITSSDVNYRLVKRDYGLQKRNDDDKDNKNNFEKSKQPSISIHYYTKDGHRIGTEYSRALENLPLVVRSEIEYELNHYGSAQLILLAVTNSERRHMNKLLKKELVDEIVLHPANRSSVHGPQLEQEITRQLAESTTLLHLVDYSSRDDFNQTNSTDFRQVSRIDVTTSLRLVQRYRTTIHRLCQLHRSHLQLTHQAEQQRHLILVANDEYYLLDLTIPMSAIQANISDIRQRQHDIFKREVNNAIQQPFDYAKYRRDTQQQQRIIEQQYKQGQQFRRGISQDNGQSSGAASYLAGGRRDVIEGEIHSIRESIRPHEHAPPRYKYEPKRRSFSVSYLDRPRYARARIIHVKDDHGQYQQQQSKQKSVKQELFIRVDDYINESAASTLRRSYSSNYLNEDGPRTRIRHIHIPGETIRIEEKLTREYNGIMYASLPYSLRYWNILYILDQEARQGRPLGSTLPQVIVNDPYKTIIPPLTQQEIRQTAQQILSSDYNPRSYTDQTLRWFLSRDNRTEIESANYLHKLSENRQVQTPNAKTVHITQPNTSENKCYVTEKSVRYEKLPDRLVPVPNHNRMQSIETMHYRPTSMPQQKIMQRSQSQPRPTYQYIQNSNSTQNSYQQRSSAVPFHDLQLSRHKSVHELRTVPQFSHPPSPSPSVHSLHSYHHNQRPIPYGNRCSSQFRAPLLTEIIDPQTGQRYLSTSREQLSSEVLGLLDKYNLQEF